MLSLSLHATAWVGFERLTWQVYQRASDQARVTTQYIHATLQRVGDNVPAAISNEVRPSLTAHATASELPRAHASTASRLRQRGVRSASPSATPPAQAHREVNPASSGESSPATKRREGEFSVRELPPWSVAISGIEIDPRLVWHQSIDLDVRPAALDEIELTNDALPALDRPTAVSVAVLIDDQGGVRSVQVFDRQDLLSDRVKSALEKMRFAPGELRGVPVNSILLLEFSFASRWGNDS